MQHACVVRCFAFEEDEEFVYLALERCKQTLADMLANTQTPQQHFVDADGFPSAWAMQVCFLAAYYIVHHLLHNIEFIRSLHPTYTWHNVRVLQKTMCIMCVICHVCAHFQDRFATPVGTCIDAEASRWATQACYMAGFVCEPPANSFRMLCSTSVHCVLMYKLLTVGDVCALSSTEREHRSATWQTVRMLCSLVQT